MPKRLYKFPSGTTITYYKVIYTLKSVLGTGGFGIVYLAKSSNDTDDYAIKIEPSGNGPLFTENSIYTRVLKKDYLDKYKKEKKLKYLALPAYIGSGLFKHAGKEFRYLIMKRYGSDIDKVREQLPNTRLPALHAFTLAKTCLNALEYLHTGRDRAITLADLKAENIMLLDPKIKDTDSAAALKAILAEQVTLVDFGIAKVRESVKDYVELKKRAGDGTMPYNTIDAHRGAECVFRSDIEILVYCLVEWLQGELPWKKINNNERVLACKVKLEKEGQCGFDKLMPDVAAPLRTAIFKIFTHARRTDYKRLPDYSLLRNIMEEALSVAVTSDKSKSNKIGTNAINLRKQKNESADDIKDNFAIVVKCEPISPSSPRYQKRQLSNKSLDVSFTDVKPTRAALSRMIKRENEDSDDDYENDDNFYTPAIKSPRVGSRRQRIIQSSTDETMEEDDISFTSSKGSTSSKLSVSKKKKKPVKPLNIVKRFHSAALESAKLKKKARNSLRRLYKCKLNKPITNDLVDSSPADSTLQSPFSSINNGIKDVSLLNAKRRFITPATAPRLSLSASEVSSNEQTRLRRRCRMPVQQQQTPKNTRAIKNRLNDNAMNNKRQASNDRQIADEDCGKVNVVCIKMSPPKSPILPFKHRRVSELSTGGQRRQMRSRKDSNVQTSSSNCMNDDAALSSSESMISATPPDEIYRRSQRNIKPGVARAANRPPESPEMIEKARLKHTSAQTSPHLWK